MEPVLEVLTRKNSDVPEGVALQLPLPVEPKPLHKKMEKLGSLKTLNRVLLGAAMETLYMVSGVRPVISYSASPPEDSV